MRKEEVVQFGQDATVVVRELTVAQVDTLLKDDSGLRKASAAELLIGQDAAPIELVCASTEMSMEAINNLTPTELGAIYEAFGRVNDFLQRMMQRLTSVAAAIEQHQSGGSLAP